MKCVRLLSYTLGFAIMAVTGCGSMESAEQDRGTSIVMEAASQQGAGQGVFLTGVEMDIARQWKYVGDRCEGTSGAKEWKELNYVNNIKRIEAEVVIHNNRLQDILCQTIPRDFYDWAPINFRIQRGELYEIDKKVLLKMAGALIGATVPTKPPATSVEAAPQ